MRPIPAWGAAPDNGTPTSRAESPINPAANRQHRITPAPNHPEPTPQPGIPRAPGPYTTDPAAHRAPNQTPPAPPRSHRGPATRRRCRVEPAPNAGVMAWTPIRQAQPTSARAPRSARCNNAPTTSAAASAGSRRPTVARPAPADKVKQRQSTPIECENARPRGTTSGLEKDEPARRRQRKCGVLPPRIPRFGQRRAQSDARGALKSAR